MELAAPAVLRSRALAPIMRLDRQALGAWTLGFAPVLYLALRGGGYDTVVYSEAGIAVWWIVLVGIVAGVLPRARPTRLALAGGGLLAGFAVWTASGAGWSTSAEQTVAQLGRVATYLGFFVLAVCTLRRDTVRPLVSGMATAFGVVGLLAVLSRLYPAAFPHDTVAVFFPGSNSRLSYPLNYADGTGEFLAIGLPLLWAGASRARTLVGQAVAAAALPVSVLAIVLTASRGGVLTAIVAVVVYLALAPDRLPRFASGLVAAAGSAILIVSLLHRHALRAGLSTPAAVSQRHQLMLVLVLTCAGVALVQVGIALAARYAVRPAALRLSRRHTAGATVLAAVIVIAVAVAAGVPGRLSHQWDVFKRTDVTGVASGNVYSRLGTVAGSNRYQYWRTALHAFESKPLTGTGPGTFQFYWAQHGSIQEYVLNAHSLYLETMAEAGIIGLLLIGGLLALMVSTGVTRTLRAPPLARSGLAAATAGLIAFCAAAAYDWVWQLAAVPVAALLLGAALLTHRERPATEPAESPRWRRLAPRAATAGLAVAAIIAVAIPFAATTAIRSSQSASREGDLKRALNDAYTAQRLEPYAAAPRLQRALLLEQLGDLGGARTAILQATVRAPVDWQMWLIRARIDAESGRALQAVRDYRRAHLLNPRSPTTAING